MGRIEYCSGYIWEKGTRIINQDALGIRQVHGRKQSFLLAVVCDGIGGLKLGEVASTYTVSQILSEIDRIIIRFGKSHNRTGIQKAVNRLLYEIHNDLLGYACKSGIDLGTTLSMVILYGGYFYLFHIGDGRIYKISYDRIKCITTDEVNKKKRGALVHAIGVGRWKIPYYRRGKLRKGQGLLICSDGFYQTSNLSVLNKKGIFSSLKDDDKIDAFLQTMVRRCDKKDNLDNSTAILIRRK